MQQGLGTALKPSHEPVVVARKPLSGTVAGNVQEWGTGALNIAGCRVGNEVVETHSKGGASSFAKRPGERSVRDGGRVVPQNREEFVGRPREGRWPANVVLDDDAAAMLDQQSGEVAGRIGMTQHASGGYSGGLHRSQESLRQDGAPDSGGASRFFYVAKATRAERGAANHHPTVKPVALMRWLVRLVTPPDGIVLDPFAGSGTTGVAALTEGKQVVLVEREGEYAEIAADRLAQPVEQSLDFGGAA